jgi:hypothetical protein
MRFLRKCTRTMKNFNISICQFWMIINIWININKIRSKIREIFNISVFFKMSLLAKLEKPSQKAEITIANITWNHAHIKELSIENPHNNSSAISHTIVHRLLPSLSDLNKMEQQISQTTAFPLSSKFHQIRHHKRDAHKRIQTERRNKKTAQMTIFSWYLWDSNCKTCKWPRNTPLEEKLKGSEKEI